MIRIIDRNRRRPTNRSKKLERYSKYDNIGRQLDRAGIKYIDNGRNDYDNDIPRFELYGGLIHLYEPDEIYDAIHIYLNTYSEPDDEGFNEELEELADMLKDEGATRRQIQALVNLSTDKEIVTYMNGVDISKELLRNINENKARRS